MPPILFLDFDGCLHPDAVFLVNREPVLRSPGSQLFEHADLLSELLKPYPRLQIVLCTAWVQTLGFGRAKGYLPRPLQERIIGSTYEYCSDLYTWFELTRFDQIMQYVRNKDIQAWLALDDDYHGWPVVFESHLISPDRNLGLGEPRTREKLMAKLELIHK
ncbi:HAD domain-containing protein [Pseudogulbenkiania ferrooxidans]|uniref:HAD domain-containing protein n=1 Tax=Pseudogulbenkiania ferrooxidans TaxID=549169 RepID=UPI00058DC6C8|nr:HAD domain-containing protein [Pseudogulbenkiania ferrooxidans]